MCIRDSLNSYIAKSEKTQLEIAKSIGVSPQTFNTWCKGIAIPRMGKVQALADYFNINKSDLIEDKKLNIDTVPIESGYTIPVLGRVAAGYGKEAVEEVIGQIEISPALAAKGDYFGLLIKGDSMIDVYKRQPLTESVRAPHTAAPVCDATIHFLTLAGAMLTRLRIGDAFLTSSSVLSMISVGMISI